MPYERAPAVCQPGGQEHGSGRVGGGMRVLRDCRCDTEAGCNMKDLGMFLGA